jgi:hypothetical protein
MCATKPAPAARKTVTRQYDGSTLLFTESPFFPHALQP